MTGGYATVYCTHGDVMRVAKISMRTQASGLCLTLKGDGKTFCLIVKDRGVWAVLRLTQRFAGDGIEVQAVGLRGQRAIFWDAKTPGVIITGAAILIGTA